MMPTKERIVATVECPNEDYMGWNVTCEILARFPKYKKWWKFWEDNYQDVPLKIISLNIEKHAN